MDPGKHPENQIIGDKESGVKSRRKLIDEQEALVSIIEPKTFKESCKSEDWVSAMNEELDQIEKNQTWEFVPRTKDMTLLEPNGYLKTSSISMVM